MDEKQEVYYYDFLVQEEEDLIPENIYDIFTVLTSGYLSLQMYVEEEELEDE